MGKKNKTIKGAKTVAAQTGNGPSNRLIWIALSLTLLAYLPVLKGEFLNWDDNQYVYENGLIQSFKNLPQLLLEPLQGNYHPLTMISLALNYAISGYEPWSYHLVNLLLHLLNTFLVYRICLKLMREKPDIAFVCALLFGVHPMHVESVAWVAERKDVLYSFFFLLSLQSYLRYLESPNRSSYMQCLLWFVFSLLSKPAAVVLPLVLLAVDYLKRQPFSLKSLTEKIPFFLLSLIMGLLTYKAQSEVGSTETIPEFSAINRILFACYSFMMYGIKFFVPYPQSPFYPFPSASGSLPSLYYLAPLFVAATAAGCLYSLRKTRVIAFGVLFYLINILLIMQFMVVGRAIIAERYTYMPYFGLALLSAWLLAQASEKYRWNLRHIIWVPGIIMVVLTYRYAKVWQTSETLWEHAIETTPGSRAFHNRAALYRKSGEFDKAIALYSEALKYDDDVIRDAIFTNRGNIYFDKKEYDQAIRDYNEALQVDPRDAQAFENRGAANLMMKQYDAALQDFNTTLSIDPKRLSVYAKLGVLYMSKNKLEDAAIVYEKYVTGFPEDSEALNDLGYCHMQLKSFDKALSFFNRAITLNDKATYFINRSFTYSAMGNLEAARSDAREARSRGYTLRPDYLKVLGME